MTNCGVLVVFKNEDKCMPLSRWCNEWIGVVGNWVLSLVSTRPYNEVSSCLPLVIGARSFVFPQMKSYPYRCMNVNGKCLFSSSWPFVLGVYMCIRMYMYVCYLIQNVAVLYIATLMYVHTHVYCIYMCSTYSTGGSLESVPLLCQTANNHISVGMSACCTYVRMYSACT